MFFMKKITTMAYVAALALVSTAGLTSCSNEEPGNGNYNGEVVKTEFSIALPSQLGGNGAGVNRMPSANVQRDGMTQFQGMKDIYLIPFAVQGNITSSSSRLGNNISLGTMLKTDIDTKTNNAKVFEDVSVPLTTASFLFYGTSAADNSDAAKKFKAGSLISYFDNAVATPAGFYFDLEQIQSNVNTITGTGSHGESLMAYLTSIACASDGQGTPKRWYEYTDVMDAGMYAMFNTFTSMTGLSSFEVERVLTDLYQSLLPISSPIANGVKAAIENATYAEINASDEVELVDDLDNFPEEFNLPSGSIDMVWDGSNHIFKVGTYSGMALPTVYTYPAQLWYTANSQIVTSNQSQKTLYGTAKYWKNILDAHTDGPAVNTRTRAVAIEDTIQYAVARLDVAVKLAAATLKDNSDLVEGASTDVTPASGFKVTAVLIGGQKQVGFDFTPNGEGTEYTIYDKVMTSTEEATPADMVATNGVLSAKNHTLVLENGTSDVMIAIEMLNNSGVDFYGYKGQLVPKGGKFYVCAKLTAAEATQTSGHVFKQDYTTTANLTLKSLRNAYNELPDLRTPELEIGFAVDLSWQSGHTYDIEIE